MRGTYAVALTGSGYLQQFRDATRRARRSAANRATRYRQARLRCSCFWRGAGSWSPAGAGDLLLGQWAYGVASGSRVRYEAPSREGSQRGLAGQLEAPPLHKARVCSRNAPKGVRLPTGPRRALGADTTRDAELRGDLACRRL